MPEVKRKGARTIKDIPKDILEQLNRGELETANLVEFLGIDARILLETVLIQCDRKKYLKPILEQIDKLKKHTCVTVNEAIGAGIYEQVSIYDDRDFLPVISKHKSDLVRSWSTVLVGRNSTLNIEQTLQNIRPFAADRHFNVRECAWSSIRKNIIQNLNDSISLLTAWTTSEDANIRRFASEATRPRSVWCEHIIELKESPELGLPILEPLMSDNSKYVQNSVGNWLNDASKTQPEFVKKLCKRWEVESGTKETKYIVKRALRTIESLRWLIKKPKAFLFVVFNYRKQPRNSRLGARSENHKRDVSMPNSLYGVKRGECLGQQAPINRSLLNTFVLLMAPRVRLGKLECTAFPSLVLQRGYSVSR